MQPILLFFAVGLLLLVGVTQAESAKAVNLPSVDDVKDVTKWDGPMIHDHLLNAFVDLSKAKSGPLASVKIGIKKIGTTPSLFARPMHAGGKWFGSSMSGVWSNFPEVMEAAVRRYIDYVRTVPRGSNEARMSSADCKDFVGKVAAGLGKLRHYYKPVLTNHLTQSVITFKNRSVKRDGKLDPAAAATDDAFMRVGSRPGLTEECDRVERRLPPVAPRAPRAPRAAFELSLPASAEPLRLRRRGRVDEISLRLPASQLSIAPLPAALHLHIDDGTAAAAAQPAAAGAPSHPHSVTPSSEYSFSDSQGRIHLNRGAGSSSPSLSRQSSSSSSPSGSSEFSFSDDEGHIHLNRGSPSPSPSPTGSGLSRQPSRSGSDYIVDNGQVLPLVRD